MSLENWIKITDNEFAHSPTDDPDDYVILPELKKELDTLKAQRDELLKEQMQTEKLTQNKSTLEGAGFTKDEIEKMQLGIELQNEMFRTDELDRRIAEKQKLYDHLVAL